MNKRILIIENSIHITGALKSVCRTAYDLQCFYDFVFVLPKGSQAKNWIETKGFNVIYELPFLEISKRWRSLLLYLPFLIKNSLAIKEIVRKEKIDLIHVNDLYNLVLPAARFFGVKTPYVCHIRFLPGKFPPLLFNFWLGLHTRYGSSVIAVSHYLYKQLRYHAKILVIYNELPVEERYPDGLHKYDASTVLYLSNVIEGKGHPWAIEVFSRLHTQYPQWRIRFVGGDMGLGKNKAYRESLKKLAREKGIGEKAEWIDFVEDVEREYKRACISLNFSESESFSITCLESLFFGCPIVATDSGGPAEIIDHGKTGYLVPKGDINAMINHVEKLMIDEGLRESMSRAGQRIVRERFSIENTSYKLKDVYDRVLGLSHRA